MSEDIVENNDSNWKEEVLNSKELVVVEFWSSQCSHCRAVEPVYAELSKEYEGKLKFAKLNVIESTESESCCKIWCDGYTNFQVFLWRKTCSRCCRRVAKRLLTTSDRFRNQKT